MPGTQPGGKKRWDVLRLKLCQDVAAHACLDGAWSPRSRATVTELTDLITALGSQHLLIQQDPAQLERLVMNIPAASVSPNGNVRPEWFTTLEPCLRIAITTSRIHLLVVPPIPIRGHSDGGDGQGHQRGHARPIGRGRHGHRLRTVHR